MKLARIGMPGREQPYVVVEDGFVSVSDIVEDFDSRFFEAGGLYNLAGAGIERRRAEPLGRRRLGAPVARPPKVICVGLNYADHAAETGQPVPEEPIIFMKATNTVIGPNDNIRIPPNSKSLDYEVELGLIVGTRALDLSPDADAASYIAGITISNDVSERDWQLHRGGQWVKGKSYPTFNPLGPYLVTLDEVPPLDTLSLWLDVNNERRQTGSTSTLIFSVEYIVRYVSQFIELEPGDLINTGTPPGVAMGRTPTTYLAAGDEIRLGITGLGEQRQVVMKTPTPIVGVA